jgi:hypothetical protein
MVRMNREKGVNIRRGAQITTAIRF